jgi:hypothetical protein
MVKAGKADRPKKEVPLPKRIRDIRRLLAKDTLAADVRVAQVLRAHRTFPRPHPHPLDCSACLLAGMHSITRGVDTPRGATTNLPNVLLQHTLTHAPIHPHTRQLVHETYTSCSCTDAVPVHLLNCVGVSPTNVSTLSAL